MDDGGIALMIFVLAPLIGLIPAAIAASKGRNFFLWWFYGWVIWIVAFPHALMAGPGGSKRRCEHCAEPVRNEAKVCPHCHKDLQILSEA
jgi:hypothetical protein